MTKTESTDRRMHSVSLELESVFVNDTSHTSKLSENEN